MDTLEVETIDCKCRFPCTPIVPLEIPGEVYIEKNIQLHCALEESTDCQFQCSSKKDLEKHIQMKHRSKSDQQPEKHIPDNRKDMMGGQAWEDREEKQQQQFNCEE